MAATLIVLLGVDGSGKTTQAARLVEWLQSHGEVAEYRKIPSGRSKLDKAARKGGYDDFAALVGPQASAVAAASLGYMRMYEIREDFKRTGTWLVVDRYVQWHLVNAAGLWAESLPAIRTLFARYPEPDLLLYLSIAYEVASLRTVSRGFGPTSSAEELSRLDAGYRSLPEAARFVEIDAEPDPDTVHRSIVEAVRQRFNLS